MAQTVLITGCSSGFGKAAASAFQQAGWNVVVTMRDISRRPEDGSSESMLVIPLDVIDPVSIEAALKHGAARFGGIDCVVNNAGQGLLSVFEVTPMNTIRALFEANIFGPMQVVQAALPYFREKGRGRVVNVSSSAAIIPDPLMAVYSASKWALDGLTEALRYELETQNVVVKLVEPGFVPSTNIVQQTLNAAKAVPVPVSYQAFVDQTIAMFMSESPFELATESDVAQAIVAAASDETDRLRYVVGGDANTSARMRWETSEDEYIAWARSRYAMKA
jgi:NAD(P)-dependent dehydrogenase (short-subunit alcohol dehydrogenase family)